MTQDAPLTFSNIAPEQFATLCAKARATGIEIDGNSGTASKYGVEVRWNYDPTSGQLVLEVLKTPFFIGASEVFDKLKSLVEESRA